MKPRKLALSARTYLVLLATVCAAPPLFASAVLLNQAQKQQYPELQERTLATSRALRIAVDRELEGRLRMLEVLSASPLLRSGKISEFKTHANEVVRLQPTGFNLILSERSGQQLVNTLVPDGQPLPKRAGLDSVEKIFATGQPLVLDLVIGAVSKRPYVGVSIPVTQDGKVAYDLSMGIPATALQQLLVRQQVPENWTVSIVDGKGVLVARTRAAEQFVGQRVPDEARTIIERGPEGTGEMTTFDGYRVLAAFSRSEISGWTLVIGVSVEATTALRTWYLLALLGGVTLTAAAALAAWLLAARITGPLGALADAAKAVAGKQPVALGRTSLREANIVGDALLEAARKRAESEESLLIAQEAGGVGTFELGSDGALTVSAEFCRIWGIEPKPSVPVAEMAEIIHPEDRSRLNTLSPGSVPSSGLGYIEYRIRRPDTGELRWVARQGKAVSDHGGDVVRVFGVTYDITDRKLAEEALVALNATLEQRVAERTADRDRMWRLSTDIMLVARFDSIITAVNPAWTTFLGWNETELIGARFLDLIHPDDLDATIREVSHLSSGRVTTRFENRYRTKDGAYRWISWIAVPEEHFIHAVGRDVTPEKEQAVALHEAEEQLRQAQKMEAVGQLTGGVAHDFNNLLQVIGGNLQLLLNDVAGFERAEKRVRNALSGVSRGARLAASLLAFARRQPLEPRAVNLARLVQSLDDMLRRALGGGIEVRLVTEPGLWNTLVDPIQVENALLNLAINARDAMNGHGTLTIQAENFEHDVAGGALAELKPGRYVMLAVSDTGSGMAPEVLERVFEPFFSTKPEGKGTGLGLSMVYGFVRQSGGHIAITSEVGQGTTVRLYLPRTEEAEPEHVTAASEAAPAVGGDETILVVEDDAEVRQTVTETLMELGYRVLAAEDGQRALAILESEPAVDLLFTDVVMPGALRGPDLARRVREERPGLAVLFTSGYTQNAMVHAGRLEPGVELLKKPYAREDLARKLRHVLNNRAQRLAAAKSASSPGEAMADPGGGLRVLLVEDDALILMSTEELLKSLGHQVLTAGSAEEALDLAEVEEIDLLLTDINLPGRSGHELAAALRDRWSDMRIVFATGYEEESKTASDGALRDAIHLRKPYGLTALQCALEAAWSAPMSDKPV